MYFLKFVRGLQRPEGNLYVFFLQEFLIYFLKITLGCITVRGQCDTSKYCAELDAVLQVVSQQCGVEGQNHFPHPAGHTAFDAAQDTVGLLGCKCTLSGWACSIMSLSVLS